jgi:hypothetical protein
MVVYFENPMQHVNKLCGQSKESRCYIQWPWGFKPLALGHAMSTDKQVRTLLVSLEAY